MSTQRRVACFDDTHGQRHWAQTGFPSRELDTHLAGLTELLCRLGCHCRRTAGEPLVNRLSQTDLLVIPPPTGTYDPAGECWRPHPATLFTAKELFALLEFLSEGGRLLAFAYRFGDAFTQANLGDLCAPLGCQLHTDAVIDLTRLRDIHPLQFHFDASREALPVAWATAGVQAVRWRSMATFTIRPGAKVQPLALSPGGACISFDCVQRRISFQSLPIAVAGTYSQGRFVLFGGPHAFETGPLGLLEAGDNRRFLQNVLTWLLDDTAGELPATPSPAQPELTALLSLLAEQYRDLCQVEAKGGGELTVAFVERLLHETGVLKALARPSWMP